MRRRFYEFFAGGGMARAGLGADWRCLLANDACERKARAYRANWGGAELRVGDIRALAADDMPGRADLAWGSFPCQDLSLAGAGAGLAGARSGTFHAFWDLVHGLAARSRAPAIIALENVCGTLTSRGGRDFAAICRSFAAGGYRLGPLVIDAAAFRPQSRPRLFLIGARHGMAVDPALLAEGPEGPFHPPPLIRAVAAAGAPVIWWRLPAPAGRNAALAEIIEADAPWQSPGQTAHILGLMSQANLAKVRSAQEAGGRVVGTVYRRTRLDAGGRRVQRAEVRFDDVAGCLRTPAGGSSRQTIVVVEDGSVRSRLITARETARLMGLPDDYKLPASYTDAYHLTGDGVVVDVVRHLARHLFEPLLASGSILEPSASYEGAMIDDLYSQKILTLAANLPHAGRLAAPDCTAERVAKLCGSKVTVDVVMDGTRVADFAQDVKACALGQAAAAVLGAHVIGSEVGEIEMARDAFRAMLKRGAAAPQGRFSDLSMLEPVKDYPARHASAMLAFEATAAACREALARRTSPADVA